MTLQEGVVHIQLQAVDFGFAGGKIDFVLDSPSCSSFRLEAKMQFAVPFQYVNQQYCILHSESELSRLDDCYERMWEFLSSVMSKNYRADGQVHDNLCQNIFLSRSIQTSNDSK